MGAIFGLKQIGAAARRAGRKIAGAQHPVLIPDEGEDFALVEPVIAGGDAIDTEGEHLIRDIAGDAETAGQILAIDDDEIELQVFAQGRQFRRQDFTPRFSDHIADE
jgi:hypothetical protein